MAKSRENEFETKEMKKKTTQAAGSSRKLDEGKQNGDPNTEQPSEQLPDVEQTQDNVPQDIPQDGSQEELKAAVKQTIGEPEITHANKILKEYKAAKAKLEQRIVENEQWWKMRHWKQIAKRGEEKDPKPASGWLFNCIISKHADCMDSYPEPNILPREVGDKMEAQSLTSIIPLVLEENKFKQVYSSVMYYKMKFGTGCYGVFWDKNKLNGLGDISIKKIDLLKLCWEPGITDIQDSRNVFHVELVDNEVLEEAYPQLKGKLKSESNEIKKYIYDDAITTKGKSMVVDWYYKRNRDGKTVLHYCKYCGDEVLFASENETELPTEPRVMGLVNEQTGEPYFNDDGTPATTIEEVPTGEEPMSARGWYDHGKYPFIFDVLFEEEGLPTGFGYVDVCKDAQESIDVMNNAIEKSSMWAASPRFFVRNDGGINKEEFADLTNPFVSIDGNLGDDALRQITVSAVSDIYVSILNNKIDELKETSGNRDVNNGGTTSGVTAASAIAAMQEQSGKSSRDMIQASYDAYADVIELVIELIRQFYDMPRKFRIMGENGKEQFIAYTNQALKAQSQGDAFGMDMGYRLPVFDVKVSAQKANPYSKISQNEMALQFFNQGFFNPQNADMALACIDMMEFSGKDQVQQKISANGTMYQQIAMLQQNCLQMAQMIDSLTGTTNLSEQVAGSITGQAVSAPNVDADALISTNALGEQAVDEGGVVSNARERAQNATSPE